MAYDSGQRRIAAFALARSAPGPGCKPNLSRAAADLRDNYETFRDLTENTLRRFLKEPKFKALVTQAECTIHDARLASDAKLEEARAVKDGKPTETILDEIEQDEALLAKLRESLGDLTGLKPIERIRLVREFVALIDRRRAMYIPAVGTSEDGRRLVRAITQALFKHVPAATAANVVADIRKLYAKGTRS